MDTVKNEISALARTSTSHSEADCPEFSVADAEDSLQGQIVRLRGQLAYFPPQNHNKVVRQRNRRKNWPANTRNALKSSAR